MPRPKKAGEDGKEVKKRSRNGCWPCKARKVKCGEEKPTCTNCQRQGEPCDYSIKLNWDGRGGPKKKEEGGVGPQIISFGLQPTAVRSPPNGGPHNGGIPGTSPTERLVDIQPRTAPTHRSPAELQDQSLPSINNVTHGLPHPGADYNRTTLPPPAGMKAALWPPQENGTIGPATGMAPVNPFRPSFSLAAYPSPADSGFGSPSFSHGPYSNGHSMQMPPPMATSNPSANPDMARSPYNGAKRMRLSPHTDTFQRTNNPPQFQRASSYGPTDLDDPSRGLFNPLTPPTFMPSYLSNPLTPAASSPQQVETEDRRISVSSLLSEDPEHEERRVSFSMGPNDDGMAGGLGRRGSLHHTMISYSETETYGQDRGHPDLDIPKNNDTLAISGTSPSEPSDFDSWLNDTDLGIAVFGFSLPNRETVFAKGGYYATPVPIKIPRKLEPLPRTLTDHPMNLLYFHHFLNHTAMILVPHDCPENPFKTVLPKLAVDNPNLLNLLLAYSACHRARLLGHAEPANRIAIWVRDVFPALRQTLENVSSEEVSNANLATAIMLASLEIISPSSFGVSIPWQNHLGIARSIIRSRWLPHSISRKDPVMYFLTRWLAYLDVLGSLSGHRNEEPLYAGNYWSSSSDSNHSAKELSLLDEDGDDDDDYTIDCLLGFTTRCVSILAQVALLARECERYRIHPDSGRVKEDWRPNPDIQKRADKLRSDLEHSRTHEQKQCLHHSPDMTKATLCNHNHSTISPYTNEKDASESLATNSLFHWAGQVHILRRINNLPKADPQVQQAVHEIVRLLTTIREGGSAEACLLFPMFTAGVEAEDEPDRADILARIKTTEELGFTQFSRARKIMEKVWETDVSWESLVNGEFFG